MTSIFNIILIVVVFGLCIFIHEFGHFIVAKKSGVLVNEFAIGMGPCLFKTKKGDTQYSLRALPLGGYCAMLGEDEESDDERAFCNIHVWKRIFIVVAGVLFNFILAFVLSIVLIAICGKNDNTVTYVAENSAALEAGVEVGDKVVRFEGSRVYNFREVSVAMQLRQDGDPVELVLDRNGEKITLSITPKLTDTGAYQLGIAGGYSENKGPLEVLKYSVIEVRYWIKTTFMSLKELVTGGVSIKQLSGPVGIGSAMNDVIEEAQETGGALDVFVNILNFCILLSSNLGVMNLLPLPALDGGRLVFLLFEAIFKKKVPSDKEALVHTIGLVLLLGLMAIVMFQDILNLFR